MTFREKRIHISEATEMIFLAYENRIEEILDAYEYEHLICTHGKPRKDCPNCQKIKKWR